MPVRLTRSICTSCHASRTLMKLGHSTGVEPDFRVFIETWILFHRERVGGSEVISGRERYVCMSNWLLYPMFLLIWNNLVFLLMRQI